VTGRLILQDTPTYRTEVVKEIAGGFVRLGEKATEVLRRLKERPGLLKLEYAGEAPTLSRACGASPFRPRSMGLYLVGRHPIHSKGAYSSGPGLNET
jgi:hypothetical protein